MPDAAFGLDQLGSYRATLKTSFTGTVDGQAQQWSMTMTYLHSRNPSASQLTTETTGAGAPDEPGQVTELNGVSYDLAADKTCAATVANQAGSIGSASDPAASLAGVVGADAAGAETVNGIQAEHATFDERALGQTGLTTSTGELWTAADGGYLVKYVLATKGGPDYFGDGMDGTVTWDYELTGVNQAVAIAVPPACPAGLVDAPLLPGADSVLRQPGLLSYTTSASLSDVIAFYKGKAATLGWTLTDGPLTTDKAGVLGYSTPAGTITIFAQTSSGGTKVFLALERASH